MSERDKELAEQAWVENDWDGYLSVPKLIALIRADERKACAEICESNQMNSFSCAQLIRKRGNT
jgi:hypothetical protein